MEPIYRFNEINKLSKKTYIDIIDEYKNKVKNNISLANQLLYQIDLMEEYIKYMSCIIKQNISVLGSINNMLKETMQQYSVNTSIHDDSYIYVPLVTQIDMRVHNGYLINNYGITLGYNSLTQTNIENISVSIKDFSYDHMEINSNDFVGKVDNDIKKGTIYCGSLYTEPYVFEVLNNPLYDLKYVIDNDINLGFVVQREGYNPLEVEFTIKPDRPNIDILEVSASPLSYNKWPEITSIEVYDSNGIIHNIQNIGKFYINNIKNIITSHTFININNVESIKIKMIQKNRDNIYYRRGALYLRNSLYRYLNFLETYIVDNQFLFRNLKNETVKRFNPLLLGVTKSDIIGDCDVKYKIEEKEIYYMNITEIKLYSSSSRKTSSYLITNKILSDDPFNNLEVELVHEGVNPSDVDVSFSIDNGISWNKICPTNIYNIKKYPIRYWFKSHYRNLNQDEALIQCLEYQEYVIFKIEIFKTTSSEPIIKGLKVRLKK